MQDRSSLRCSLSTRYFGFINIPVAMRSRTRPRNLPHS
jgi:hypothetical protein